VALLDSQWMDLFVPLSQVLTWKQHAEVLFQPTSQPLICETYMLEKYHAATVTI
jgi:hypothetical protein